MPTDQHESEIQSFRESHGYIRYSFLLFIKLLALRKISEGDHQDLLRDYDHLQESDGANQSLCQYMMKKWISLADKPENYEHCYFDIFDVKERPEGPRFITESITEMCKVVPDLWKYEPKTQTIKVIEVKDTSGISFSKLAKFGLIEDFLFYYCGVDFDVYEICSNTGASFRHMPGFAFDVVYDGATYLGEEWRDWPEAKMMREYHAKADFGSFPDAIEL